MLFADITSGRVYKNQQVFNYPTGVRKGYGEIAFICAPTWKSSLDFISSDLNRWVMNGYKRYYIPTKYYRKIGTRLVKELRYQTTKQVYFDAPISNTLTLTLNTSYSNALDRKYSMIYDFSYWNEVWLKYHKTTTSAEAIVTDYVDLLMTEVNNPEIKDYHKTIIIPINLWAKYGEFGMTKDYLDDPISILLCAVMRFPNIGDRLKKLSFFIVDTDEKQFMLVDSESLTKKKINLFRSKLKGLTSFKVNKYEEAVSDSEGNISEDSLKNIESNALLTTNTKKNAALHGAVVQALNREDQEAKAKKPEALQNEKPVSLTVNSSISTTAGQDDSKFHVMSTGDIKGKESNEEEEIERSDMDESSQDEDTSEVHDEELDDTSDDEDIPDEIMDELNASDEDATPEEVASKVKKVLITKFKPDISDEQQERISKFMGTQNEILKQSASEIGGGR